MQTKEQILQSCTVEGLTVKLPNIKLERKLYQDVAKSLELIGGKWKGGKIAGFVFHKCPKELLAQIANGEKRDFKKEFQFFGTSDKLADYLVQLAEIEDSDIILEPEAGQGAIIKAIQRKFHNKRVNYFELMDINRTFLSDIPNTFYCGNDFLKNKDALYTKIIANPPFSKNQDIDHIIKMYLSLKTGGRIVSIASKHWQLGSENKCNQFREWLKEINAEIIEVPAGEFKESGTNIATCIIIINK